MSSDNSATDAAILDLASQANVSEDDIVIVETREVQWPDGSLGCPEEGKLYTQAVVEGTQVLLEVDGRIYDYRADPEGNVVLCPSEDKDGGYDFVPPPGIDQ